VRLSAGRSFVIIIQEVSTNWIFATSFVVFLRRLLQRLFENVMHTRAGMIKIDGNTMRRRILT
jgi:hypothetical protein